MTFTNEKVKIGYLKLQSISFEITWPAMRCWHNGPVASYWACLTWLSLVFLLSFLSILVALCSSFCFWKLELVLNLNFPQNAWGNGVCYGRFGPYWRFMVLQFWSSLKDFFLLVQSFLISVTAPMFLNLPVSLPIHFLTPIL